MKKWSFSVKEGGGGELLEGQPHKIGMSLQNRDFPSEIGTVPPSKIGTVSPK